MNVNGKHYIQQFLAAAQAGQVTNDAAADYGVRIQEANVADGDLYWRVIGVHHLLPTENQGDHTILIEALDEAGNRIRQGKAFAAFTWEGRQDGPDARALDKVDSDPMGCDFPMGLNGTHSVWMRGWAQSSNDPSDRVEKLHTRHKDEPFGVPAPGNTTGHHSFYVLFQLTRRVPATLDKVAMLRTARKLREEQMAGDAPFTVYARDHDLGAPVTAEFSAGGYRARGFTGGIVYAPIAQPKEIAHAAW
jgi:hypothetical protein